MKTVYYTKMIPTERQRIQKIEMLDEIEQIDMMQQHYYMLLARKCSQKEKFADIFSLI